MNMADTTSALRSQIGLLRLRAQSTVLRGVKAGAFVLPAPALLAVLSAKPAVLAGTGTMLVLGLLLVFVPGGIPGVILALLAWLGAMSLGACGLSQVLMERRIAALEAMVQESIDRLSRQDREYVTMVKNAAGNPSGGR
jgi:hypothetical protein